MCLKEQRNSQCLVTLLWWFEPVSRQQQVQQLMVMDSGIRSPPPGHNLPHGHPERPLGGQGHKRISVAFVNLRDYSYLIVNIKDSGKLASTCKTTWCSTQQQHVEMHVLSGLNVSYTVLLFSKILYWKQTNKQKHLC